MLSCHYVADNQRLSWLHNGLVVTSDTDVQDPLRYSLRTDIPGQYDLVILNVNSGVAGQYCCAMEPADQNGCAELIYIGRYLPLPCNRFLNFFLNFQL